MAARSMASGTISFGLVAIPIRLFSTSESSASVSLNWLHAKCGTRVKQQYYCPVDDEVVARDDLVKGYQFAKDQFVLFDEEELASLSVKPTHSIDITEFLPVEQVDPIYFDKSYYLGPNKGGERPYKLLSQAMRESGKVALAHYAARGKSYLVLLRPFEEGLIMHQLHYADEIRSFSEVPIDDVELRDGELGLAQQLIDQITSDSFAPEKYEDDQRLRLWQMIEQKIDGQEVTAAPAEEPKAQVIDLMEALKASLASGKGSKAEGPAARAEKRQATG